MTNREIDALAHQHVMGNTPPTKWQIKAGIRQVVPHYSTDPAASKQLRDRMRELGWSYTIKTFLLWDAPHFECVFYGLGLGLEESVGTSEETSVALAALRAIGIEVPA